MKKSILFLTLLCLCFTSQVFAKSILVGQETDKVPQEIKFPNGDKYFYYETDVLVSKEKPIIIIEQEKKIEETVCNCPCEKEEGITIETWFEDTK